MAGAVATQPSVYAHARLTDVQLRARQQWAVQGLAILRTFRNGQCTDLVARMRPDVISLIYQASWAIGFLNATTPIRPDFLARNWARLARAAGLIVSSSSRVGAVVVWQPGIEGADAPTGHVGIVIGISGSRFTTREENVGGTYHYASGSYSTRPLAGRLFILP